MVDFAAGKKLSQGPRSGPGFGEIVGQAALKEALLCVAANDDLDGVLVRGEKGTAKSTAVRALADLLPRQRAISECPYGCPPDEPAKQCAECRDRDEPAVEERPVPLVTLPLGATREMVVGTLSLDSALDGTNEFQPGLLARANRGLLYVDEVNLLDDHLVDVVLDAAASGVNRVERDGVSVAHPADFTLVGTMNPEEGDLRPQLRDRFALQATVTGCEDLDDRVAIIRQAVEDDVGEGGRDSTSTATYRERLRDARDRLDEVALPEALAADVARLCREAGVDGHRGDIATARTARTLAALDARDTVIEADVERAAELALPHRLQSRPFEDAPDPGSIVEEHFEDGSSGEENQGSQGDSAADESAADDEADREESAASGEGSASASLDAGDDQPGDGADSTNEPASGQSDTGSDSPGGNHGDSPKPDGDDEPTQQPAPELSGGDEPDAAGDRADHQETDGAESEGSPADGSAPEPATPIVPGQEGAAIGESAAPDVDVPDSFEGSVGQGNRSGPIDGPRASGPRVRTEPANSDVDIDAAASVRAASRRGSDTVESRDLRQSVRASRANALVLFVVDASASMRSAMRRAKGTVLELLKDAYQQRDEVGFVAVAGESADVVLPPTDSVTLAARHLKDLPTGDRTPLPDGLRTATEVIDRADPAATVVVIVTDGRANVADGSPTAETRTAARALAERDAHVTVVDAGTDDAIGVTDEILAATGGERVPLDALSAERIDATVGARTK